MALPLWLKKLLIRTRLAGLLPSARRLTDGGTRYLKYLSDRVLAAPVEELLDPAYFPATPSSDVIDLNQPAPRSESAVSLSRAADRSGNPPAWGLAELRNAITDLYVRRDGRTVDPDREVFVTHGATGAFSSVLDALINPGDGVVLLDPCSPLFSLGAKSRRASIRWVPTWNEDGRIRFPLRAFERAVRGAKLLVLSDPGNPTGACLAAEDFEYIVWLAAGYDVLIYADEAFTRFRYDTRGRSLATMKGGETRVLTAGSVAQGYGLGAARVGWLTGPRTLIRACTMTGCLSAPYVAAVCQRLAARALTEPEAEFLPVLDEFRRRRQYTVDRLKAAGLEPEWPAAGYFVWVPVTGLGLDGRSFAQQLLKERNVLVGAGCVFGPSGTGHIRVSFACDDGRLREGLSRLTTFVDQLRNPTPARPSAEEPTTSDPPAEKPDAPQPVFSRV